MYTGTVMELVLGLKVDINSSNAFGETALMQASLLGHVDICKWLLEQPGIEVNQTTESGATALMMTVEHGTEKHMQIAQMLLEHGANPNGENKWKTTPLHIAAFTGNLRACELLLERGASKENKNQQNKSPIFYAQKANCDKTDSGQPRYNQKLEELLA